MYTNQRWYATGRGVPKVCSTRQRTYYFLGGWKEHPDQRPYSSRNRFFYKYRRLALQSLVLSHIHLITDD